MTPQPDEPRTNPVKDESSTSQKKCSNDVPLVELELQNVSYSPVTKSATLNASSSSTLKNKRTRILHKISTRVSPYKLTAWMGPSGSGKSSLISVAADLVRTGNIEDGSLITVNGEEGRIPKRLVGVVWQDDLLLSNLTVFENVYYAARLKTPESTPDAVVRQTVHETVEELGLGHRKESLVGSPLTAVRGVSGGERKRVSVAVELVVKPSVLLLDEPTSGLDATTSQSLISTLKDLSRQGHSIAVVIHQPRTTIYNMFDHLLLLSQGHTIFDGVPSQARHHLESCPSVSALPPETGIADWIMDVISEDEEGNRVLAEKWRACVASKSCVTDKELPPPQLERRLSSLQELESVPKFNTSFLTQLKLLTQRTVKQQRGDRLTATAVILQLTYLFFTALFWWRLSDTTASVFERNSLLFFILIAQGNGVVINAVTVFQRERILLDRERSKKMYGVGSFFLAKTASDMTNNVLLPVLYGLVVYWTANYRLSVLAYIKFGLALYATISSAQSLGLFLSILIPSVQLALVLAPPITLFFFILAGFYLPLPTLHPGIKWATWLSFARYGYSALLINEYHGRDIPCSDDNVAIQIGGSDVCPLPGEEVLESLGITGVAQNYWFNIGVLICLQVVFRLAAYVVLRRSK